MEKMNKNIGVIQWVNAHGFNIKVINEDLIYWQTAVATAEYHNDHLTWHSYEYFDEINNEE